MRSKLLIMSTAALLAGSLAAAGQSIQPGDQDKPKGQTQGQVQDKAKGQTQGQAQGQAQDKLKGQAQGEQDKLKGQTQGQAPRDQDKLKGQAQGEQDKLKAQGQKGQAQGEQDKLKSQTQGQVPRDQDKAKSQTQGQAPREQGQTPQGQTQQTQPGRAQQGQTQQGQQGQTQQGQQGQTQQGAREGAGGGNVSVTFTTEQRTRIRETVFRERNAPRVSSVNFSINVGTVIPRTVRVIEVPEVIVEIHPEWRRFKFFIVNEEIVIVEPDTLRIVAIINV